MIFKDAVYLTPEDPDEDCNPYIEALPPIWSYDEIMEGLSRYLPEPTLLRHARPEVRMAALLKVRNYFQPSDRDVSLALEIFALIRSGYLNRNPTGRNFIATLKRGIAALADGGNDPSPEAIAAGIVVIGVSGVGKTTSVRVILECLSRVIRHRVYRGEEFRSHQIVWMKINCPKKGSILKLCKDFVAEVDKLVGETYTRKHGMRRASTDDVEGAMAAIANAHGLGLLVIDEIQNLKRATEKERALTLTFLVSLMNGLGVPILFVGTKDAYPIIKDAVPTARRTGGNYHAYNRFALDDSFSLFMEGLWEFQLVDDPVELDPRPADNPARVRRELAPWTVLFYHYCQGIADIAVKLFIGAQRLSLARSIHGGRSTITAELVAEVWNERFKLLHEHIAAIRQGREPAEPAFSDALVAVGAEQDTPAEIGTTAHGTEGGINEDDGNELPDGLEQGRYNDSEPEFSDLVGAHVEPPPSKAARARLLGKPATQAALKRAATRKVGSVLDRLVSDGAEQGLKPSEAIAGKRNGDSGGKTKPRKLS